MKEFFFLSADDVCFVVGKQEDAPVSDSVFAR